MDETAPQNNRKLVKIFNMLKKLYVCCMLQDIIFASSNFISYS